MDDTGNGRGNREDVETVYETWRRDTTPPSVVDLMNETTFEAFVKRTWVAGWVARGRIPAGTRR
jgi:hypothetical protein